MRLAGPWRVVVIAALGLACLWPAYAQIPPSAFIVGGGGGTPPPPPPPPGSIGLAFDGVSPSPPPPSPPATAPSNQATATPQSASNSSSISGGAIAGIVIGALAGVAIIAALAFFVVRRKRAAGAGSYKGNEKEKFMNDIESGAGGAIQKRSSNPHDHLGTLNAKHSGLAWSNGEEIKSAKTGPQRAVIEESLSDFQPSHSPSGTQLGSTATDGATSSFVQVLPDNTSVVIRKGPGGSVHISQVAPGSTGMPNSQASTVSAASTAATGGSSGTSSSMDLPNLPWSDWVLKADDIHFVVDTNGEPVKLGSGAYGTVYKATIDGVTECACKVFHDVHNQLQQADILREVAILKSCRDRNIVQFLGACIMDERIMLVTELMEAGDLWHALIQYKDSGALSWYRRGRRIAIEVARGLHFLHRHKIIHFDLKSANVLLTRDGTAKVSDVGFANILSNTHLSNNVTAFTFAWAAPEVLLGQPSSDKVDIYSYGVLLWEIVTGLHPQRGQLRDCVVPGECPVEVEALIQRCLSVDPTERPSCKEIVEILQGVEDVPAPSTGSVSAPESNFEMRSTGS